MKNSILFAAFLGLGVYLLSGCGKEKELTNPYDSIKRNNDSIKPLAVIDSASIAGLHAAIFAPKCAIPSCHGGTFEPDFRTPLSSYNTMVYQKVIKNSADGRFSYRVVPYDTSLSWLHERLVTDDVVLGQMPRYMPPLSKNEMYWINKWIMDGAKDLEGNIPKKPNTNITPSYMVVYSSNFLQRFDTIRAGLYAPFEVPKNENIRIYFGFAPDESKPSQFLNNQVKFSTSKMDFSNAISVLPTCDTTYQLWYLDINSGTLPQNQTIYLRYYGRDPDHTDVSEFPTNDSYYYYHSYYSFIVK